MKKDLKHLFDNVKHLYIVPTYIRREDKSLEILDPYKLRDLLSHQTQTKTASGELDDTLKRYIQYDLNNGNLVLRLTAGSPNSLDE